MAELKTRRTADSVDAFLNSLTDDARRQDCLTVLRIMTQATKAQPHMWGSSIVGFGSHHYKYASGREGDWFLTGFSPRKQALTLYLVGGVEPHHALLAKLGKHKAGRGCLYIKRLKDVDVETLKALISASVAQARQQGGS